VKSILRKLLTLCPPRDLGLIIVTQGDQSCSHEFEEVKWDRERFGPDVVDMDPDPGGAIAFPKATYKYLFRCKKCGAEVIKSVRALI